MKKVLSLCFTLGVSFLSSTVFAGTLQNVVISPSHFYENEPAGYNFAFTVESSFANPIVRAEFPSGFQNIGNWSSTLNNLVVYINGQPWSSLDFFSFAHGPNNMLFGFRVNSGFNAGDTISFSLPNEIVNPGIGVYSGIYLRVYTDPATVEDTFTTADITIEAKPTPFERCAIHSGDIAIPYQECIGLAHLYTETNGDNWWRRDGWFINTDVTTWRTSYCNQPSHNYYKGDADAFCNGAVFDRQQFGWDWHYYALALTGDGPIKNIYGIQLPGNQLQGSLSSGLVYFPELAYLYLGTNSLTSADITHNTKLRHLELNDNDDSNPWVFDLSYNPLLEYVILDDLGIESLVLDHQYLYYLDVDGNNFTSLDVSNLPALIYLDAEDNYNMTSITGFNGKQYLEYLRFEDSAVSGHVHFADMPALRDIRVEGNQITSVSFSNLPSLNYIDLDDNYISYLAISDFPFLTRLDLDSNQLTGIDVSNLPSLERLDLDDNQLTSLHISDMPALRRLYARDNSLTSVSLSNLPLLESLYLNRNMLTDNGFDFVPTNNTFMRDFDLRNNQFTTIPSAVFGLNSISWLDLASNCIDVNALDPGVVARLDDNTSYTLANQMYCVSIDLNGTIQGHATAQRTQGSFGGSDRGAVNNIEVIRNGFLGDYFGLRGNENQEIVYTWDEPVTVFAVHVYWQAGGNTQDPGSYFFSYRDAVADDWITPSEWEAGIDYQDFHTQHVFALHQSVTTTAVRLFRPSVGRGGGIGLSQFLVYGPGQPVVNPPSIGVGSGGGGGRSIIISPGSFMTIPQTIASRLLTNHWQGQSIVQVQDNIQRLIMLNRQVQASDRVSDSMKELFIEVIYELIQRFAVMKSGR